RMLRRGRRPVVIRKMKEHLAAPGLEAAGLEIALGPAIVLAQEDLLGLLSLLALHRSLVGDVAEIEVAEQAVKIGHVDVGNARGAADQDHVLVVSRERVVREIGRPGADQRIVAQRVDQQKLGMNKEDIALLARQLLLQEPVVERESLDLALGNELAV